ncbi:D-alanyl-D-alanine-carboxypeptidase/endopeptidase AmpH [Proteus myxofaciens]|uniref:Penicillin-binding protein n=1 Tax=Proteus myxofaciens ATCC 19692 TaxID=1354337 RepID=A0A198FPZ1_9GAMM|nr:D-alanyl-D-alanine-carboxypeptidase/endopeptidase AmpH [Proteus myxofaciens]OAT27047.1 penicillin-binding protein [Proteus myxofaciens ATCC 19692]
MKKHLLKYLWVPVALLTLNACSHREPITSSSVPPAFNQHNNVPELTQWPSALTSNKSNTSALFDKYASQIYQKSNPQGMVIVLINNAQSMERSFGTTTPDSRNAPSMNSLIRIASITKLMTSEVMLKLQDDGKLLVTDPLQKYNYYGVNIPVASAQSPIRLYHLASHTSGFPREQPGGKWGRPVFIWPTHGDRWDWLKKATLTTPAGSRASYSNLAYDLLADALVKASGKSYPQLLKQYVTQPAGMRDTTLTPTPAQCQRLLIGYKPSPCSDTLAAAGSGGVYSTPADMKRWMQQFLTSPTSMRKPTASKEQSVYFPRSRLSSIEGMDVAGRADGIGLGWVYMAPANGIPAIYQKTGGGGGFNTYMATIPELNIGVFVVITRKSNGTKFSEVTQGTNALVRALAKDFY